MNNSTNRVSGGRRGACINIYNFARPVPWIQALPKCLRNLRFDIRAGRIAGIACVSPWCTRRVPVAQLGSDSLPELGESKEFSRCETEVPPMEMSFCGVCLAHSAPGTDTGPPTDWESIHKSNAFPISLAHKLTLHVLLDFGPVQFETAINGLCVCAPATTQLPSHHHEG